jgi:hypothetical protein
MDLELDRIREEIEDLERRWFEAHRSALSAHMELTAINGSDTPARGDARARLTRAECDKATIMRKIEALEDSLVS